MFRGDWLHEPIVEHVAFVQEHGTVAGEMHWQVLQNVRAWLMGTKAARGKLVLPPVPVVEERSRYLQQVGPLLETLDRVVRQADVDGPAEERYDTIAHTASCIAERAEETGAYATGLGYAQVVAALLPAESWKAYHVGRLARKADMPRHAAAWLRRAWRAARAREDMDVLVLVLEGLGHVHREEGKLQRARSYYRHAFEAARRQGRAALAGDMLADLCLVEMEMGNLAAALPHFEQALSLYETEDPGIVQLAQEVAWLLMDAYGVFQPPFRVFDALLEHVWEPRSRIFLQAHRARAAAGVRLYRDFERSWNEVFTLATRPDTHRVRAPALIQLSLAATLLGNFPRAQYAVSQASPPKRPGPVAARLMHALESDPPAEEAAEGVLSSHPLDRRGDERPKPLHDGDGAVAGA